MHYQSFDIAVQLVASQGRGAYMAKEDFKSAFCSVPMRYQDLNLLGIKVQRQFFIDCPLPFGASMSCVIFKDISTLIHCIADKRASQKFIHYLDDFFMVNRYASVCSQIMNVLKQVCEETQMPIAPEKSEGPTIVVEFLGLTLDTDNMVIHIPQDKLQDITQIITKMVKTRKTLSWELQSLAEKLNFVMKVVPTGKCYKVHLPSPSRGSPPQTHRSEKPSAFRPVYVESFSRQVQGLDANHGHQSTIRKLLYKEFVIFNLKLKDHQLQVNSFIKSNFP